MPTEPLMDVAQLDLENPLEGQAEIQRFCKQRGRLALVDDVVHFSSDPDLIAGTKSLSTDDWWCADHIPGRPIFPGVLMIEGAAQLCTFDYLRRQDDDERFLGFGGVDGVRFRGIVEPPGRIVYVCKAKRLRRTTFTYAAQGFADGKLVFEAEILGVAL